MLAGCSGEDGTQGLPGDPGSPGSPTPIALLLAGSEPADSLQRFAIDIFAAGLLPFGSTIDVVDVTDSIPPLAFLNGFDAVLAWTRDPVVDPTSLGDRLADFVDAGGGLVLGQMSFVDGAGLEGRVMTAGYSPLESAAPVGSQINRSIDFTSIASPIHPIFNGTTLLAFPFYSTPQWSNPTLGAGATALALDTPTGAPAVAINAAENVVAINTSGNFFRGGYANPPRLFVNALLIVAGSF